MKTRTVTEYRVLSQRTGNTLKEKRLRSLKAVRDRVGLLTSDEPWRFYGDEENRSKLSNSYACCAGTRYDECNCGGLTMREHTEQVRKDLPPIEWVRVESRQLTTTQWAPVTEGAQKP